MRGGDTEIFDGKNLSQILEDVYNVSKEKRKEIKELIVELSKHINSSSDAVNIAPIIKDFFEVSVKNDDQMAKIATIVQRMITAEAYKNTGPSDPSELLSEDDKEQLIKNATADLKQSMKEVEVDVNKTKDALGSVN